MERERLREECRKIEEQIDERNFLHYIKTWGVDEYEREQLEQFIGPMTENERTELYSKLSKTKSTEDRFVKEVNRVNKMRRLLYFQLSENMRTVSTASSFLGSYIEILEVQVSPKEASTKSMQFHCIHYSGQAFLRL